MKYRFHRAAMLLTAVFVAAPAAMAHAPTVTLLSPAPGVPLVINALPHATSLVFSVTHTTELSDLNVLTVTVNGASLIGPEIGNPFKEPSNVTGCGNLIGKGLGCVLNGNSAATVTVPWTITTAGDHVVLITIKHQSAVGEEEETVVVQVVSAGYPAPPAVANQYINSTALKSGAAKIRGCVLNQIAHNHGQAQKYNAAPGPYNIPLIQQDVRTYWTACGGTLPAGL